jgi:hypothetical protein
LGAVVRLREEHLPEVDLARKAWLAANVSARLVELNLRQNIQWKDNTLWLPTQLGPLLTLVSHYQLSLDPDSTLVDALMGWDSGGIPKYYKKYGFSAAAKDALEVRLENPPSPQGLEALVRFVHETDIWSDRIKAGLKKAMEEETLQDYVLVLVLETLTRRGLSDDALENLAANAKSTQLRDYAFQASPDGAHQLGGRFSESGHAATSSSRGTDAGEERNRGGDETSARGTGGKVSARSYRLLSVRAAHGASPRATSGLGCTSRQNIVNERESSPGGLGAARRQHPRRPEVN